MQCKECNYLTNNCVWCDLIDTDNDLCIWCKDFYYEIYNSSNINSYFKKCYQSPEGYYLDEKEENGPIYKPCFNSCLTCQINGNRINHNCLGCKQEYIYEIDFNNSKNCFQKYFYYH